MGVLNNSHRSFPKTPRMIPSQKSSRNNRSSHRHSFKHKHYSSSDRHSPWPPGEFDRARGNKIDFDVSRVRSSIDMKRNRISFDGKRDFDSTRRRKAVSSNQ